MFWRVRRGKCLDPASRRGPDWGLLLSYGLGELAARCQIVSVQNKLRGVMRDTFIWIATWPFWPLLVKYLITVLGSFLVYLYFRGDEFDKAIIQLKKLFPRKSTSCLSPSFRRNLMELVIVCKEAAHG
jgi:hypothetical protein